MKNYKDIKESSELASHIKDYISKRKLTDDYLINFDCPVEIITMLANDPNIMVRKLGILNKNRPYPTLERIIKFDDNSTLKKLAVQNPNCTKELLEGLLVFNDYFIREAAKKRLEKLEQEEKTSSKLLITIDKIKRTNKSFIRKFYHSIKVDKDNFLVLVGDHYEIKNEFLSVLNFLNLEDIDTTNVKIAGLGISESILKIDPQTIYMKDLSNTTLDDKNLISFELDGVNMDGTNVGVK